MFKHSPSRTQRSKSFKIKHGLQIFLLIAICFWLLYQVKHSHDKKKAFDEGSIKFSSKLDEENKDGNIGRKGLYTRVDEKPSRDEISEKDEVMEGDEEDNKPEEEEEEEESTPEEGEKESKPEEEEKEKTKHEEDEEINKDEEEEEEIGEEENNSEEVEEEGRGAGDDEIDEQDQERDEEEAENDVVDEQDKSVKEDTEQGGIQAKLEQMDNAGSSEDQDHDRNTQEAREENYKRDDASSAVVRDTHLETTESESGSSYVNEKEQEHSTEMNKKLELQQTNATTSGENNGDQKAILAGNVENSSSVILKTHVEKGINESSQISTTISHSEEMPKVGDSSIGEENRAYMDSGSAQDQDHDVVTSHRGGSNLETYNQTENSMITSGAEKSDTGTKLSNISENGDIDKGQALDASSSVETVSAAGQNTSLPSTANENNNGTQHEGTKTTVNSTEEADESKASLTKNGVADVIQSAANITDSNIIPEEEKEAHIDLGTLPETETEGSNRDDAALK